MIKPTYSNSQPATKKSTPLPLYLPPPTSSPMASHHHHCHPPASATTTSSYCCHYSTCCTPPPPPPDPLLHSITSSHIHHSPPQPHPYSPYYESLHHQHHHQTPYHPPPPPPPTQQRKHQDEFQHHHYHHEQQQQLLQQTQPIVSSLLRRIAALESSLRHQSPSNRLSSRSSLRHAAARTIQTHFRAFLVRRSRTLRQLKYLASIKSTLNALKTSFSNNALIDSQAFSRKAMNLLLKLDSIQGGDPMIRDAKRSINRDIIRFIEFIDGILVKRSEISSTTLKNVRFGSTGNKSRVCTADFGDTAEDGRVLIEKMNEFSRVSEDDDCEEGTAEIENPRIFINGRVVSLHNRNGGLVKRPGGVQAKVKKSVSFADNRNVYRVFPKTHESVSGADANSSDGSGSIDEETELVDNLCREIGQIRGLSKDNEDDEEVETEDGGSPHTSDGERNPRSDLRDDEDNHEIGGGGGCGGCGGHCRGENGNFVFSAPVPVKMESKADLMKKRKGL